MDNYYTLLSVIIISLVIIAAIKISSGNEKRKVFKNNVYTYAAKDLIMTRSEAEFLLPLVRFKTSAVAGDEIIRALTAARAKAV